jgi:uncharacterized lipoprotein
VLSLGSCSFWDEEEPCDSVEEYQFAQAAPEISVPAGLDKPDPAAKLKVPEEPVPAEPLSKNAACLQRPPNYFDKPLKDATS